MERVLPVHVLSWDKRTPFVRHWTVHLIAETLCEWDRKDRITRQVCTEDADFVNPFELSLRGGLEIAGAIASLLPDHGFGRDLLH